MAIKHALLWVNMAKNQNFATTYNESLQCQNLSRVSGIDTRQQMNRLADITLVCKVCLIYICKECLICIINMGRFFVMTTTIKK
jgi:hypothetical protein